MDADGKVIGEPGCTGAGAVTAEVACPGTSGCAPLTRVGARLAADSMAPMAMLVLLIARRCCAPMAIFARCGGRYCGISSGLGNGNAPGVCGALRPALSNGLPACNDRLRCPASTNPGLAPRTVPVHSAGTSVALLWTQLLLPATLRPALHGSRLGGPQYGASTSLAGFSRTMDGVPDPIW